MKRLLLMILFPVIVFWAGCTQQVSSPEDPIPSHLPAGFVYVDQVDPGIQLDIRYYSENNFVGNRVDGYNAPVGILTCEAATALTAVNQDLKEHGYGLKLFDAYRPQKAVDHFIRWSWDVNDQKTKSLYYPRVDKAKLFELGYLSRRSAHSRGSSVDVTIVSLETGKELDMGTPYDFLDPLSGWEAKSISAEQTSNRQLLKNNMQKHGFKSISTEWWHYTLINEPYPNRYYDFIVE
jgi:D-alanyl-D-alanine dipeptidase